MSWTILGNALLIFALRLTDVSMGTVWSGHWPATGRADLSSLMWEYGEEDDAT